MKYKRNHPFESMCDVWFEDGTCVRAECQTIIFSKLNWIRLNGLIVQINQENLEKHKIERIEFMTPSTLYV